VAEAKIAKIAKICNRQNWKNVMMEDRYSPEHLKEHRKASEARYAYYRRCQVFRKGGEQCKAPAEKGSHICYAHAGQLATAVRRERERRAVLEEAVAQMRKRGRPECEMADLFMDFKSINVTLAVAAQAVIAGRIDCKTAGRLVVQLQTFSKLLWQIHRKGTSTTEARRHGEKPGLPELYADERRLDRTGEKPSLTAEMRRRGENRISPQICADERRLDKPGEKPHLTTEARRHGEVLRTKENWAANQRAEARIALVAKVLAVANRRDWAHAPPELLRAA
jgi:hypothetical protein